MPNKNDKKKINNQVKQEPVIKFTDADKKRIKEDLIKDVEADIKADLVKKVSEDVFSLYTISEKDRIKNELTEEIKEDVKKRVVREEALLSRKKSLKIFRMSIYIIVLLGALGYGMYRLYKTDNIMILNKDYEATTTTTNNVTSTETTTKRVKTLDELKNEYAYLMDKVYINDFNILLGERSISDLSASERLEIAYYSLNASDITRDGKVFTVLNTTLQTAFENVFGSNATYQTADFAVDGLNFTYVSGQDRFLAISDSYDNTRTIQSEIVNIEDEKDYVVITEVVGYVKENKLYALNNLDTPIVTGYSSSVLDYKDSLTTVSYTFNRVNGSFKLFKVSAK